MSNIAKEIVTIQAQLETERAVYDSHCQEIAEVLLPRQDQFFDRKREQGEKRNEKIVDSVAQEALNKFAAAMESILTPRSSKWHRLSVTDPDLADNQEVQEYLDAVNDTLFRKRYAPSANYASQQHEAYMSLGAFGTSVLMTEDDPETQGIRYRNSHISEHAFVENAKGQIRENYRKYKLTGAQAVQKFGEEKLPKAIKLAADKESTEKFEFIHCVRPNDERKPSAKDFRSFEFSSFHVSVTGTELLSEGGFRTFPYHISRYLTAPNEKYGRSPGMTALSEIKMVNAIRKSDLRARHMAIDPPVLVANERGLRRPLLKPSGINYGALDENGNPLMRPYNNQARIDVSNDALNQSHKIINDIFLVTLFQILVETPSMTATEVLQRAQEKGALLSPTAGRQQSEALGPMIEREIDLLSFSGQLPPMPDALAERDGDFEIEYTAPLNVLQRAGEAQAATQILNDTIPLAQFDPSIMNRIDFDEYLDIMKEARGVPARMFRSPEEVAAIEQAEAQAQQLQSIVEAAPSVAGSVKDLAQAEAMANA